jgi:hypothetical protein
MQRGLTNSAALPRLPPGRADLDGAQCLRGGESRVRIDRRHGGSFVRVVIERDAVPVATCGVGGRARSGAVLNAAERAP